MSLLLLFPTPRPAGSYAQGALLWSSSAARPLTWSATVAITTNLTVYRGQTKTWTASAALPPVNISGWSLTFTVRPLAWTPGLNPPPSPLLLLTVGTGIAVTDVVNGAITLTVTSAQTQLTPGDYWYDLERTDANSEDILATGRFTVLPAYRLN